MSVLVEVSGSGDDKVVDLQSLAALNDPWSCTSESIRVKNGVKKRVRWLIPLHIMMVEPFGGVDAGIKWGMSESGDESWNEQNGSGVFIPRQFGPRSF